MIGIYCITNKINNKKYFGQSTNIEEREKEYFNYGRFPNDHLKRAFNKYGKKNFEFKIIKCCKEKYLDRFEKLYIRINDTMNPNKGYNKESGGHLNKHHSEETLQKMSEAHKGEKHPMWGKNHSEESKKKMSENTDNSGENNPMWGKKHTPKSRKKMSEASLKNYPRIIKYGKTENEKQRYAIIYNGKLFANSISKERLCVEWYDEYPDIELIDETVVD